MHVPRVLAHSDSRMEWTMLCVALTLAASAALVATLSHRHSRGRSRRPGEAAEILARP